MLGALPDDAQQLFDALSAVEAKEAEERTRVRNRTARGKNTPCPRPSAVYYDDWPRARLKGCTGASSMP